ncbi:MAG TPA: hypothetical protein VKM55_07930 [Candidatus Lokiarchaeia archaeon]|nr:hypothetical protein [Candidatus Lokiarchaeia archaeon]
MTDLNLIEVIQQDLQSRDLDKTEGLEFRLSTLIGWKSGTDAAEKLRVYVDEPSNYLDSNDGNKFADELLKPGPYNEITSYCMTNFVLLATDNWHLFIGVDSQPVIERLLKKFLPLTNIKPSGESNLSQDGEVARDWFVVTLDSFVNATNKITIINITTSIIEKMLDHVEWARNCVEMLDIIFSRGPDIDEWYCYKLSQILATCTSRIQRRVFKGILERHGNKSMLVEALLRAGSEAEEIETDILDLLESMDQETIGMFLYHEARVVHVNYFMRFYAWKFFEDKKRKQSPRKTISDEFEVAREEKQDAIDESKERALHYLMKANPWALDRQFISWNKRISSTHLDPVRINMLKGKIKKLLDAGRRDMIHSDELSPFLSKIRKSIETLQAAGVTHERVKLGLLVEVGPLEGFAEALGGSPERLSQLLERPLNVLTFDENASLFTALPAGINNEPWIIQHGDEIVGMGLSGLFLKKIPASVLRLRHLRFLDASNNVIKTVNSMGALTGLRYLDLSRNNLSTFSLDTGDVPLKYLDVHCNILKEINLASVASTIHVLDLSRNQFGNLNHLSGLNTCSKLGILDLAWNHLDSLQEFPTLPALIMLYVNGNDLVKLTSEIGQPRVRRLDISENKLGALKGIDAFPNALHVNASHNYLKNVKSIAALTSLKAFIARYNQLSSLGELKTMKTLELIDLQGNPLTELKDDEKRHYLFSPASFTR